MVYHWFRSNLGSVNYDYGAFWAAAIPAGSTYRRVRWSWGFAGDTSSVADISATHANVVAAGLVTTIGNGTEVPPFALGAPNDVAPPTQRWVWWEQRQPVVTAVDQASGVITWRDSQPQEPPDVKVPVLATGIPGGDTLNLWFTWQSYAGAWDVSGSVFLYVATSVLYSTP